MASLLTSQPIKALYTIFTILKVIPLLAFLAIKFIFPGLRQHSRYSYRQAFGVALVRNWFDFASATEFRFPLSLEPGSEGDRWVQISPASSDYYIGRLADKICKPATIGGTWYPHPYRPNVDDNQRIVLHLHGGAYVMIGARDGDLATGKQVLADTMQSLVFFPQYRLSTYPDSQFPAPLQDAVTSYKYLLDQGVPASRIILSGDSAGGNLAIALLRYIGEQSKLLPWPAVVLLWSPWVDLAFDPKEFRSHRNVNTDLLPSSIIEWGARAYSGKTPRSDAFLSPMRHAFRCTVPMFITRGKMEVLYDDIGNFAHAMEAIRGNTVQLLDLGETPHDIALSGVATGFVEEAVCGGVKALEFLTKHGL